MYAWRKPEKDKEAMGEQEMLKINNKDYVETAIFCYSFGVPHFLAELLNLVYIYKMQGTYTGG